MKTKKVEKRKVNLMVDTTLTISLFFASSFDGRKTYEKFNTKSNRIIRSCLTDICVSNHIFVNRNLGAKNLKKGKI